MPFTSACKPPTTTSCVYVWVREGGEGKREGGHLKGECIYLDNDQGRKDGDVQMLGLGMMGMLAVLLLLKLEKN